MSWPATIFARVLLVVLSVRQTAIARAFERWKALATVSIDADQKRITVEDANVAAVRKKFEGSIRLAYFKWKFCDHQRHSSHAPSYNSAVLSMALLNRFRYRNAENRKAGAFAVWKAMAEACLRTRENDFVIALGSGSGRLS